MTIHIHPSADHATRLLIQERTSLITSGNQLLTRDTKIALLTNHKKRKQLTKTFSHHGNDFDPTTPTAA